MCHSRSNRKLGFSPPPGSGSLPPPLFSRAGILPTLSVHGGHMETLGPPHSTASGQHPHSSSAHLLFNHLKRCPPTPASNGRHSSPTLSVRGGHMETLGPPCSTASGQHPHSPPAQGRRRPARTEDLNKIQSLIIAKIPEFK